MQSGKKYKKTIHKYNKTQMWQYAKRQYSNMTKHEKTKYKCDNWQKTKWQNPNATNPKRQNTNVKELKQKDKIQIWHNTNNQNTIKM